MKGGDIVSVEITEAQRDAWYDLVEALDIMGSFEYEDDLDDSLIKPSQAVNILEPLFNSTETTE